MRFIFALLVVISHSYPLSGNSENAQWIYRLTDGQMNYASLGLNGFFIISGFFIYRSFARSGSAWEFMKKRVLRIFPGLFIVLLLSVLMVPLVYEGNIPLLQNWEWYTYLPYNLSLYGFQGVVSGVFDGNFYHAINGSLWTIRYEFTLYLCIAVFFLFRRNKRTIQLCLLLVSLGMLWGYTFFREVLGPLSIFRLLGYNVLNLGTFFVLGSLLATFELERWVHWGFVLVLLVLLGISVYLDLYDVAKHILFTPLVLMLGFLTLPRVSKFGKWGDSSYGIYIYSFPIQQVLVHYFKPSAIILMLCSVPLSMLFGYLSWHLVEKRALIFKTKSFSKLYGKWLNLV
ncbi:MULTISPECIES: acyltransferase family protein [Leeuwenhoekiella]|uniref:acyltransferase family protein n=1 Tax=Leeuwenhoekiella TaxID=283735 RepID=UPI00235541D1|nr:MULTISPECIES: acyltransferase [Leeuwenhoekiella]